MAVQVSPELLAQALTTGFEFNGRVRSGLPADARLVSVQMGRQPHEPVRFLFEHESFPHAVGNAPDLVVTIESNPK